MHKRLWSAILTSAVLAAAGPAILWSKPPDLPVSTKETCQPVIFGEKQDAEFGSEIGLQSPPFATRTYQAMEQVQHWFVDSGTIAMAASSSVATVQLPEQLPMPEEAADDEKTGKYRIELGDLVIDLTDMVKAWNKDVAPLLNDWLCENLGDPRELLQAVSEILAQLSPVQAIYYPPDSSAPDADTSAAEDGPAVDVSPKNNALKDLGVQWFVDSGTVKAGASTSVKTIEVPEQLPMPEEATDGEETAKFRIELGDLVIDFSDAVNALNGDWATRLNDWVSENLGDPGELLQSVGELVGRLWQPIYYGPVDDKAQAVRVGFESQKVICPPATMPPSTDAGPFIGACVPPVETTVPKPFARPRQDQGGYYFSGSYEACAQCRKPAETCDEAVEEKSHREHAAERLLEIGKQCQARGDVAMAKNCFEEVMLLCPATAFAATAKQQMASLQSDQGGTEASEPQDLIGESDVDVARVKESKRMLNLAEKYAKAGDQGNAYLCYAESCAICPACVSGQRAAKDLARLDVARAERKSGIEEQEPPIDRTRAMSDADWQKREEARHLYQLAEHCRVGGDISMALSFYRETHEVSPNTYYGQRAMQRIHRLLPCEGAAEDRDW
jgi:tetratricopeptide (TPR) repeat protein